MSNTPQTVNTEEIQKRILQELDNNGKMDESEYRRLVLISLNELLRTVAPLPDKVRRLETVSIVFWAKRNPKILLLSFIALTLWFIFAHDVIPWLISNVVTVSKLIP